MKIDTFIPLFIRFLKDKHMYENFYQCYKIGLQKKLWDYLPTYCGKTLSLRDFCINRWGSNYDLYHSMNPFDKCLYLAKRNGDNTPPSVDFFVHQYYNLGKEWQNYAREHS